MHKPYLNFYKYSIYTLYYLLTGGWKMFENEMIFFFYWIFFFKEKASIKHQFIH